MRLYFHPLFLALGDSAATMGRARWEIFKCNDELLLDKLDLGP